MFKPFVVACMAVLVSTALGVPVTGAQGDLKIKLVDAKGAPVGGAVASLETAWIDADAIRTAKTGEFQSRTRPDGPRIGPSNANGEMLVPFATVFARRQLPSIKTTVYFLTAQRRLGAFVDLSPPDVGDVIRVTMQPLCFVHAKVDSPDMEADGHVMKTLAATVFRERAHPLVRSNSQNGRFGMLLPPGIYQLAVSGVATDGATYAPLEQALEVPPDQREVELPDMHLGSSRFSEQIGKPAPEFDGIIEWRNGDPVTMAQLRGKVVILDFWSHACSICLAEMPSLMTVQQRYHDNPDLVIIAVHSSIAPSLDEAYEKCAVARAKLWPNGELPFRVALDSDGPDRRSGFMAAMGTRATPTTILIDRDGNVAQRFWHSGVPGFADAVDRLMRSPMKRVSSTRRPTTRP